MEPFDFLLILTAGFSLLSVLIIDWVERPMPGKAIQTKSKPLRTKLLAQDTLLLCLFLLVILR